MRRTALLALSFWIVAATAQAQSSTPIPNPGFEHWTDGTPDGWTASSTEFESITRTTESHSGAFAARGEIKTDANGFVIDARLVAGSQATNFRLPFDPSFKRLTGYYQLTGISPKTALVIQARLFDGNEQRGLMLLQIEEDTDGWTPFSLDLVPTPGLSAPDEMIVSINAGLKPSEIPPAQTGAVMLIDDLAIETEEEIPPCTVTSTGDSGPGSLRQALLDASAGQCTDADAPDVIRFDLPGDADDSGDGPHTIRPLTPLPEVPERVEVDGLTQPGADCTSWPPQLQVELDGTDAGGDGLVLSGGGVVRGLVINRFAGAGIVARGDDAYVFACNFIGTDVTGTADLGNGGAGLSVHDAPATIGGTVTSARNLISGNDGPGIEVRSLGGTVQGNYIGTDASGTVPLGNARAGLWATGSDHRIGGDVAGAANVIAFNGAQGVTLTATAAYPTSVDNVVQGNRLFGNGGLSIDLDDDGGTANDAGDGDDGANRLQNYPVLSEVLLSNSIRVEGTLESTPSTAFRLEFFESDACGAEGRGEGRTVLAAETVTTDAAGVASFTFTFDADVPRGAFVAATATDPQGNTSEFSDCFEVVTGVAVEEAEAPTGYVLSPNYPNPFNPQTTIRYALPVSGPVRLAVLDVLGREVALLVDAPRPAGPHTTVFDATGLPSGLYVARMQSGGVVQTRTMLLMK
ncbi:MAG: T9SS type A sorting domain-containing protein [Bacteroidetes bacterium]|nr:T9SS type A sorting domain-containing protein [Bacteroidota bacterium]